MSSIPDVAVRQAALALREAHDQRRPIAPISVTHGIAGLDAAHAVAELNTRAPVESGRRVVVRKVGFTSTAVQAHLGALGGMSCRMA